MRIKTYQTCLWPLLFVASAVSSLLAQQTAPTGERYGVIEIGSSGIKAIVIERLKDTKVQSEDPPTKTVREYDVENSNAYQGSADGVATAVGVEVSKYAKRMHDEEGVPDDRIYVVGSSGIPEVVRKTIGNNIEDRRIEYIDVESETRLTFKGIVPPWRMHLNEVVMFDIGSGNSKGTYLDQNKPALKFISFSIPFGSKVLAKGYDGKPPEEADKFVDQSVNTPVKAAPEQYPGMRKCTRLYLVGGINWAMTMLLHPEQFGPNDKGKESDWVKLSPADIDKFCAAATTNPATLFDVDLSSVRINNVEQVKKDIKRIRGIFSLNTKKVQEEKQDDDKLDLKAMKGGALLLRAFADAMDYKAKKAIFFSKRALYAWPHGYVLEKIASLGKTTSSDTGTPSAGVATSDARAR